MIRKTLLALAALVPAGAVFGYSVETKSGEDLVLVRDKVRAARASGAIKSGEPVTVTPSAATCRGSACRSAVR